MRDQDESDRPSGRPEITHHARALWLERCPFCGERGELALIEVEMLAFPGRIAAAYVECHRCSARGPRLKQIVAARRRWNKPPRESRTNPRTGRKTPAK